MLATSCRLQTLSSTVAGNRLTRTVTPSGGSAVTTTNTYDDLNRHLSSVTSGQTTTYTYDLNGNRLTKDAPGTADDTDYFYDVSDRTADDTDYFYDVSDRLISADVDGDEVFSATYDARTRRLSKTEGASPNAQTTLYRYDGGTNCQRARRQHRHNPASSVSTLAPLRIWLCTMPIGQRLGYDR